MVGRWVRAALLHSSVLLEQTFFSIHSIILFVSKVLLHTVADMLVPESIK